MVCKVAFCLSIITPLGFGSIVKPSIQDVCNPLKPFGQWVWLTLEDKSCSQPEWHLVFGIDLPDSSFFFFSFSSILLLLNIYFAFQVSTVFPLHCKFSIYTILAFLPFSFPYFSSLYFAINFHVADHFIKNLWDPPYMLKAWFYNNRRNIPVSSKHWQRCLKYFDLCTLTFLCDFESQSVN